MVPEITKKNQNTDAGKSFKKKIKLTYWYDTAGPRNYTRYPDFMLSGQAQSAYHTIHALIEYCDASNTDKNTFC